MSAYTNPSWRPLITIWRKRRGSRTRSRDRMTTAASASSPRNPWPIQANRAPGLRAPMAEGAGEDDGVGTVTLGFSATQVITRMEGARGRPPHLSRRWGRPLRVHHGVELDLAVLDGEDGGRLDRVVVRVELD